MLLRDESRKYVGDGHDHANKCEDTDLCCEWYYLIYITMTLFLYKEISNVFYLLKTHPSFVQFCVDQMLFVLFVEREFFIIIIIT